ncbi:MAG: HTH domain-containing protein [Candidatus Jordarchaeum sp.]|uniref:HTH domain-containing protein n=1 Tax=Candidatus Jordarchaeum sp. TaxID=2823881 RepID=UPI00404ACF68
MTSRKFSDEELRQLNRQELTVREIAERLGVSEATVYKYKKKLGLKTKRQASDERVLRESKGDWRSPSEKWSIIPPPPGPPF